MLPQLAAVLSVSSMCKGAWHGYVKGLVVSLRYMVR